MRPSFSHVFNILAHVIAVLVCLAVMIGLISQSASAQPAANNIDWALQEALSRQGSARAIIQMRLPQNARFDNSDPSGLSDQPVIGDFSKRAAELRHHVTQARQALAYDFAISGIEVDRAFAHLPFLVSTLTEEQLEDLKVMPGVVGVYEDRAYLAKTVSPAAEEVSAQPSLFFSVRT